MQVVKPVIVQSTGRISRASKAYYYSQTGYLTEVIADQIRDTWDPYTLEYKGALLEGASTNLWSYSEDLTNAVWTKTQFAAPIASQVDPKGTSTAYKLAPNATNTTHYLQRQVVATAVTNNKYTVSFYAKAAGYNWIYVELGRVGSVKWFYYDLSTATLGGTNLSSPPVVERLLNGYFRVSITFTADSTSAITAKVYITTANNSLSNYAGNSVNGVIFFGMQAEVYSMMTSYIQTTTSTATRAADVITKGLIYTSATNVPEWSSASVSYTIGDSVSVGTFNNSTAGISLSDSQSGTYQCLVTHVSNTSNGPLQSSTNWQRVGPTNQFAALDTKNSSMTIGDLGETLKYAFTSTDTSSITVANAVGGNVTVTVADISYSGEYLYNLVYTKTISLLADNANKTDMLFNDIPLTTESVITVSVDNAGGTIEPVGIGNIVAGKAVDIGATQYGVSAGITDYSKKQTDEFGNTSLLVRNYSKRMDVKLFIDNTVLGSTQRLLYALRATPCIWIASSDQNFVDSLVIYGYYKDFNTEISYPSNSICSLTIEGLT